MFYRDGLHGGKLCGPHLTWCTMDTFHSMIGVEGKGSSFSGWTWSYMFTSLYFVTSFVGLFI